jgi:hypothetical protein
MNKWMKWFFVAVIFLSLGTAGYSQGAASHFPPMQPNGFSAGNPVIIPEAIWAPARGGGEWGTELVLLLSSSSSSDVTIQAEFYSGTEMYSVVLFSGTFEMTLKYNNILETMQNLDPSNTYYRKVGALILTSQNPDDEIIAEAKVYNGGYGKSLMGMVCNDENSIHLDEMMIMPNISQSSQQRSSIGIWNGTAGGYQMKAAFIIFDQYGNELGGFSKSFLAWEYWACNPFLEAGLGYNNYENCILMIVPISTAQPSPDQGLYVMGSSSVNSTNDSFAHYGSIIYMDSL